MDFASSSQTCGHTGASGPDQSPTRSEPSLRRRPRPEVNSERVWGPSLSSVPTFLPTKPLFKSSARAWTTGPSGLGCESERRPGKQTQSETDPGPQKASLHCSEGGPGQPPGQGRGAGGAQTAGGTLQPDRWRTKGHTKEAKAPEQPPRGPGRLAASDTSCPSEPGDAGGREQPFGC